MIGPRIAGGLLAVATLATATACATLDPSARAEGAAVAAVSPRPTDHPAVLLQQALPDVKGRTFTAVVVDLPPAARAAPHRHGQAFVYAYVLEGTVRSQLDGKPVTTYHQGQNWVEQPGAHHLLTENTSPTKAAKLLVVYVSHTGDRLKYDDPGS